MINKIKTFFRLLRQRKLIDYLLIKNKMIRNLQFQYKTYKKIKRKYKYVLDNKNYNNQRESKKSNKVWVCWLQGEENAPMLVKKCIDSIRRNIGNKELVIITNENYQDYVQLPDYIMKKFQKGIISYAHFSDLLRIALLVKYGGIWLDATVFLTDKLPEYILNEPLFMYKSISLDKSDIQTTNVSNWCISAYSNNTILATVKTLLLEYWKKENVLDDYYIFHLFFKLVTEKYADQWNKVPTYSNVPPHILQFELLRPFNEKRYEEIKSMSSVHKLNKSIKNEDDNIFTFYDYIIKD